MRYTRNRIYISDAQQQQIKQYKLFLAGCGIGSVIAECALRMGFEQITIVDGDQVELSNLNRQNYVQADAGKSKAASIKERLLSINPYATITVHHLYLTTGNIEPLLEGHDVAINALDFQSDVPLFFDELCQAKNIPALHPYNIGWAALVFVVMPGGSNLSSISPWHEGFEKTVVQYFIQRMNADETRWIEEVVAEYGQEEIKTPPPQLSVASWLLGACCTSILFKLVMSEPVRQFPEYYFLTTM